MSKSVLIVDDNNTLVSFMSSIFKTLNYELHVASSGEEALEKIEGTSFDVAVIDIKLPGIMGDELGVKIREKFPNILMASISGLPAQHLESTFNMQCFDHILEKPVGRTDIENLISK